jgi:hypothetical protein
LLMLLSRRKKQVRLFCSFKTITCSLLRSQYSAVKSRHCGQTFNDVGLGSTAKKFDFYGIKIHDIFCILINFSAKARSTMCTEWKKMARRTHPLQLNVLLQSQRHLLVTFNKARGSQWADLGANNVSLKGK